MPKTKRQKSRPGTPWKERTEYKLKQMARDLIAAADRQDTKEIYTLIEGLRKVSAKSLIIRPNLPLAELQQELSLRTAQYNTTLDPKEADRLESEINTIARRIRAKRKQGGLV